ncbi:hypothetical protein SAMN05444171_2884 [Bradyrhizobium lablabi]|jgi:hypothetical protein|uniref:Uncharacterized protein n=2 Tax=Bradyrhizobium TaxID=374 RepID=A0ABY0PV89_9BRAD|nr:hypothetical protein SAMN05444163_4278 [Bradyrhizobium ottawaense]SED02348.1 hypothetical protein SAMN05444171_2884 [Bradyrhizobium lablabi]SHL09216.1 hypothetical protein SAMN05444321_1711 [Bradyrhizobium lablabi]
MTVVMITIAPAGAATDVHEDMRGAMSGSFAQDSPRTVSTMASAPALRSTEIS